MVLEKVTGLNKASTFGTTVISIISCNVWGSEGVGLIAGVGVIVGVKVIVGDSVMVGVKVMVGVCVIVGVGGKMR